MLKKLYYSIRNSIRICKRGVVAAYNVVWECVVEQWLGVHCVGECVVEQWLGVRRMHFFYSARILWLLRFPVLVN